MNIPYDMRIAFEDFMVQKYGVVWLTVKGNKDEVKRCMFGERLLVIREHASRRSAERFEIVHGNRDALKALEQDFWVEINAQVQALKDEGVTHDDGVGSNREVPAGTGGCDSGDAHVEEGGDQETL